MWMHERFSGGSGGDGRDTLAEEIRRWSAHVATDGSPLYGRIASAVAEDPDLLDVVAESRRNQPVPLLFLAAVHYTLAAAPDHALARWYPTVSGSAISADDPAEALRDFVLHHRGTITDLVRTRSVQTNEVGRCALLLPAFGIVARRSERPLAIIEIGCSAGLNLRFDDYRVDYVGPDGDVSAGRLDSPVVLTCAMRGRRPPLPDAGMEIGSRLGIDLRPLYVADPADAAWVRALVWPDQPERHRRLGQAMRLLVEDPPALIAGDALIDLPAVVGRVPAEHAVCVVTSHVMNQLSPNARDELDSVFERLGGTRPIWRISNEWLHTDTPQLELAEYRGDHHRHELLARVDKHGAWIDWTGPD